MKSIINNLSMRGKLITLVTPALLVILYFATDSIALNSDKLDDMNQLHALVQLADIGDPLTEALQLERARTSVVLSRGVDREAAQKAEAALKKQRQQTDTQFSDYQSRVASLTQNTDFSPAIISSLQTVEEALTQLGNLRSEADSGAISSQESEHRYTQMINGLINRIPLVIARSTNPELTRSINAYYALAEAAESAGRESAAGAALINSGSFNLPIARTIAVFEGRQKAFIQEAAAMLSEDSDLLPTLKTLSETTGSHPLTDMRSTLFRSPSGLYSLDAAEWINITTERLGILNSSRKTLLQNASSSAAAGVSAARQRLYSASGIAAFAIAIVTLLMLIMVRAINRQINSLLNDVRFVMDSKDLTRQVQVSSKDEVGTIGRAINDLFGRFGQALQQIDKASIQLATATEETSSTAGQNAAQTKGQQEQITQVSAATEELTSTSEQISQNTQQVADAAHNVMQRSQAGEVVLQGSVSRIHSLAQSVQDVNEVITELEKRSSSIVEVVDVIRKVADQTNLLALNAAIEAARAGEHGRGFAVVADEVRTLARQTHESTTQIADIINGFQVITENAGRSISISHKLANETSEQSAELEQTFAAILSDVNGISDMASQIATASEQQVAVTRELAVNMESVNEVAALTLTGSQEISHVTGEQARLARQLQDLANEFKVSPA